MAGAVCPSCGVAVTPGYVRCPKCRKPLPRARASSTVVEGGTAVDSTSRGPLIAIIGVAIVGVGLIAYLGLRGGGDAKAPTPVANPTPNQQETDPTEVEAPTGPEQPTTNPGTQPAAGPDPGAATDRLERSLKRERLWSTVSFDGNRVDVRSGSCGDPKMAGIVDASAMSLKAAGLTRLRCLEQSGQVVSDRDL